MNAEEAKALSEKNARKQVVKDNKRAKEISLAVKKVRLARHKKWEITYEDKIRSRIEFAVKNGWKFVKETMHSSSYAHHKLYGGDNFIKNFEYNVELQRIIKKLRKDKYIVTLVGDCVEHDESVAYMNSGGECGSEESYLTYDTILKVEW